MEEEKNCKNCGYYMPHYVKRRTQLAEVDGHCTEVAYKNRRKKEREEPCSYWKPQENKKEERRETIKEVLRNMEKSLRDIKAILQSDQD